ncbi:NAD-dependent epimerase/dehydratase family protein [Methylococcus mesophilus]|uniref:NAD-dependent epimerase/dehydratase family protein n=1 Tax=Methylococcus mesophilus TaxID=2993564 RepID=UPI00224B85F1|nr:GDP-mannose 4,6-dehydratase [Methylococcus mesophilus]UZR28747.1 GDP-mannose 4,6-dehydratase [Methylococcus mesophilus]
MAHPSETVLVTGATGFTGRYLVDHLRGAGYVVVGTTCQPEDADPNLGILHADLNDEASLRALVEAVRPGAVIHLAAISFVPYADALNIYRVNVLGTENLLRTLDASRLELRKLIIASSSNVYGSPDVSPISETVCPRPVSHYACSKLAMEHMAALYADRFSTIITRPFNYTGPGQSVSFFVPKLVAAFRRHERVLELGDLDVVRDISDVRAVTVCYRALLESDASGVTVNLCTGQGVHLTEVFEALVEIAGYRPEVRVKEGFLRSNDIRRLVGCPGRLHALIGEPPAYALRDILLNMYRTGDSREFLR